MASVALACSDDAFRRCALCPRPRGLLARFFRSVVRANLSWLLFLWFWALFAAALTSFPPLPTWFSMGSSSSNFCKNGRPLDPTFKSAFTTICLQSSSFISLSWQNRGILPETEQIFINFEWVASTSNPRVICFSTKCRTVSLLELLADKQDENQITQNRGCCRRYSMNN